MRRLSAGLITLVLSGIGLVGAGAAAPAAAATSDADYDSFDARVTDVKGVATDVTAFGYATGTNVLLAHRGEAEVDIPFRLVLRLDIGDMIPERRRAPATVVLRSGKRLAIELDQSEEDRLMAGETDFGEFRIRLGKVRRIDMVPAKPAS